MDFTVYTRYADLFATGLLYTVLVSAIAIAAGMVFGSLVCAARISSTRLASWAAMSLIEIVRNVPFLVLAFLIFYGLPVLGVRLNALFAGIMVLSLYSTAYFAEIIRGAIEAVPKGQLEAASALGVGRLTALRRFIFPQAWPIMLPPVTNQMIVIVKESSVLSVITVAELTYEGHRIVGLTFSPVETYLLIALLYWILNAVIAWAMGRLEIRARWSAVS